MATALDRDLNTLDRIVEKYCLAGKEEDAIECLEWARGYADDSPQQADIQEVIRLLKKAETFLSAEGKLLYADVSERLVKRLWRLLEKESSMDK